MEGAIRTLVRDSEFPGDPRDIEISEIFGLPE